MARSSACFAARRPMAASSASTRRTATSSTSWCARRSPGVTPHRGFTPLRVRLSCAEALGEVSAARRRGVRVLAETCPQYLFLSDEAYEGDQFDGAKFVMSPPLRSRETPDALWRGLAEGDLQVVATDHCPFLLEQKARGRDDFSRIPNGAPGIEPRRSLRYDEGVRGGRIPIERFVEITAAAPARIFGLYPQKGAVAVGSDADLVVFDPSGTTTISAATHHMRVDYNPYEGRTLGGAVETVVARGDIIVDHGRFVGAPGRGRFLKRAPFAPLSS